MPMGLAPKTLLVTKVVVVLVGIAGTDPNTATKVVFPTVTLRYASLPGLIHGNTY
jgi:hypothetical protein